jgi:3-ketoacyl-CoA synthase
MFTDSTVDFQTKVLARSGLGDDTYLPPCMADLDNPVPTMANARWEFEQARISPLPEPKGVRARHPSYRP